MNKEQHSLRGLAILMIVMLHSGVLYTADYSFIYHNFISVTDMQMGVELLFVLAGFFLSKSLCKYSDSPCSIKKAAKEALYILKKKIKRLLPALLVWTLIPFILSIVCSDGVWLSEDVMRQKFISSVLFVRNFTEGNHPSAFGYIWAVSLEMQFFVAFSFLFFLTGRNKMLCLAIIVIFINTFYRLPGNETLFMFRFDSLLGGYVAYILYEKLKNNNMTAKLSPSLRLTLMLVLIISLMTCGRYFEQLTDFKFSAATLISIVIVVLASLELNIFQPIESKLLNYFADRSYSLYCCHIPSWFIMISAFNYFGLNHSYMWPFQIIFMLICTEITYRYIENMIMRLDLKSRPASAT